ncbi:hypothetical protein FGB62_95g067 [Gracilaria domingensis]|nr:hypothetical protein FGB62_95g067 [Gracilaria domingensis]
MISVEHDYPDDPVNEKQTGYYNLDMFITIDKEPTETSFYFWAMQLWFNNGDGSYMGLQTGANLGGPDKKIAIFSIWNALNAKPGHGKDAYAGTLGDCRFTLPDQPEWWGAWVMDMETAQETFIGQIKVPASWRYVGAG